MTHRRSYNLLSILLTYAPDRDSQVICSNLYNQMQADGLDETDIEKQLVGALHDGLFHGNWPWVVQSLSAHTWITVENPEPGEMPFFDGWADEAFKTMTEGRVPAVVRDTGRQVTLIIEPDQSYLVAYNPGRAALDTVIEAVGHTRASLNALPEDQN